MKKKRVALWGGTILILVVAVGGAIWIANRDGGGDVTTIENLIRAEDHVKGSASAMVVVTEYSDFQCPACKTYYPVIQTLAEEYGDKVAFVYRHFPLPQHQHAKRAPYAAEAAGKQGKFWEMHDKIFDNQDAWSRAESAEGIFLGYARELGLDEDAFAQDSASDETAIRVKKDLEEGRQARINATPTFFINGSKIESPRSYDEFKRIISERIAKTQ